MFDAPNYVRLGLWATPDYWKTSANNPIWAIMGVKCRNEWEMETGQMFIDKKRHLDLFLLIKYMLENHDWVRSIVWPYATFGSYACFSGLPLIPHSGSGSRTVTRISSDGPCLRCGNDGVYRVAGSVLLPYREERLRESSARTRCCSMTPGANRYVCHDHPS
jgi:hypothetical protein